MSLRRSFALAALLPLALACSSKDDGAASASTGSVQVFVVPEETITDGLEPGTGEENVADGWKVEYTRFLVTIGNFRAKSTQANRDLAEPTVYVLDLKNAPAGGYVTASFTGAPAARFDKVGSDMPAAAAGAKALPPTTDADLQFMITNGYSIYFEATLTKADGQRCKPGTQECSEAKEIKLKWGFPIGTSFDDCAPAQGDTGFAVPAGGTVQVKPTIHGDHWFFSDITEGAEITKRYVQYVVDADLDGNGETTLDELKQVKAADAFPTDKYKLSGGVGGKPIATAYDFVESQARTIHDFQGDGECPTRAILR
jgi:hypothetical protein